MVCVLQLLPFNLFDEFEELDEPFDLVCKVVALEVNNKSKGQHAEHVLLGGLAESVHAVEKAVFGGQQLVLLEVVCHALVTVVREQSEVAELADWTPLEVK